MQEFGIYIESQQLQRNDPTLSGVILNSATESRSTTTTTTAAKAASTASESALAHYSISLSLAHTHTLSLSLSRSLVSPFLFLSLSHTLSHFVDLTPTNPCRACVSKRSKDDYFCRKSRSDKRLFQKYWIICFFKI